MSVVSISPSLERVHRLAPGLTLELLERMRDRVMADARMIMFADGVSETQRGFWSRIAPNVPHDDYPVSPSRSPYAAQVFKHTKAFDFESRINPTRNNGSISCTREGHYCSRFSQFLDEVATRRTWPRAIDWTAPEIRPIMDSDTP